MTNLSVPTTRAILINSKIGGSYVTTFNNDHRLIGPKLGLFHIQEEASGSIFWHEKGLVLYRLIEQYIRDCQKENGYEEVRSPQLFNHSLWEKSGHIDHYGDNMFNVGDDFILKPMNCPAHAQIFNYGIVSYKDLPRRIAEFGCCHRNEPSGSLHGMMRVRQFTQDDAHIFCLREHIENEIDNFCELLRKVYLKFGFSEISVALSLRPANRAGDDAIWDDSEEILKRCLDRFGAPYVIQKGDGAFYGPKLEFSLKDQHDRWWQCGTLQLDFVLPSRLNVKYVDSDGCKKNPVMIHRAILGSFERFIGIVIEHYGVNLPLWLAPVQIAIIPVSDHHVELAKELGEESGLRYEILNVGSVPKRLKQSRDRGILYSLVVGDKEIDGMVNVKKGNDIFNIPRHELKLLK